MATTSSKSSAGTAKTTEATEPAEATEGAAPQVKTSSKAPKPGQFLIYPGRRGDGLALVTALVSPDPCEVDVQVFEPGEAGRPLSSVHVYDSREDAAAGNHGEHACFWPAD